MENQQKSIGALWKRQAKTGAIYYSGNIGDKKIVVFENRNKTKDNHPNLNIFESTPNPYTEKTLPIKQLDEEREIKTEDIPF
jgi:hypothetical protein